MVKQVLRGEYDFNNLADIGQDIDDALAASGIGGEFTGTFILNLNYYEVDRRGKDDCI